MSEVDDGTRGHAVFSGTMAAIALASMLYFPLLTLPFGIIGSISGSFGARRPRYRSMEILALTVSVSSLLLFALWYFGLTIHGSSGTGDATVVPAPPPSR
ncbi:hypothetical protein D5S17_17780 [Pseudonocardiaceae bacterium YIM PH 21723]|nr:hypothetical protein D5S17_17780 [Pseudonocardiaceae bacterium YIM PH 21723]